jgi:hypothetical protein
MHDMIDHRVRAFLQGLARSQTGVGDTTPYRLARTVNVYASDGLLGLHRHAFLDDPAFQRAYLRGARALGGQDWYQWQWRVHIGLWTAASANRLDGDFVECGVNYGFLSSAMMEFLDWDRLGKTFYLLDTFAGVDPRFITVTSASSSERSRKRSTRSTRAVAFLHIDMNCAPPEVAALRFFGRASLLVPSWYWTTMRIGARRAAPRHGCLGE